MMHWQHCWCLKMEPVYTSLQSCILCILCLCMLYNMIMYIYIISIVSHPYAWGGGAVFMQNVIVL